MSVILIFRLKRLDLNVSGLQKFPNVTGGLYKA